MTADGDVAGSADSSFAIFGFRPSTGARAIGAIAAAPMSYRVIAKLRHRKLSAIGLYAILSLRHFRLARSWSLSLGAGAPRRARQIDSEHDPRRRPFRFRKNRRRVDRREPPVFLLSDLRCGPIDGARTVELFAATGSLHIGAGRQRTGRGLTPSSRFDISGWRDRGLYPLVQGRRDARGESTASMTRGGGHFVFAKIAGASTGASRRFSC